MYLFVDTLTKGYKCDGVVHKMNIKFMYVSVHKYMNMISLYHIFSVLFFFFPIFGFFFLLTQ